MRKHGGKILAGALALLLFSGFLFQDDLVRSYIRLDGGPLDRFAQESLARGEDGFSARYGPWDVTVWRDAGIIEFSIQRSAAFGGIEKGFYYSEDDTPDSFQATGYPMTETGAGWTWTDPYGNHGYTERIRPHWFWYEAVL